MMKQCEFCFFYDSKYEELRKTWGDVSQDAEQYTEKHYCIMYDNCIPVNITNGKKECEFHINQKAD